jgi:hypothetical protein
MFLKQIKIVISICFVVGLSSNLLAQNSLQDETLAVVGEDKITTSLFQELWEMSPHLNLGNKSNSLSEKINFLNTIIAYKLWYRNSDHYTVDTSSAFSTAIDEIKKMYVRDELYRHEILGKISVSNDERNSAYNKQAQTLVVNYILSSKEEEIHNIYKLLNSGYPFDSLLVEREERTKQSEPVKINYGDYSEPVEDELFSLKPGTFSKPIQFGDGYYIFFLKNSISKIWGSEDDQKKELQKVEEVIKKRKENVLYDSFMKKTLNGIKADVNGNLFKKLETGLVKAFEKKKVGQEKNSFVTLSIDDFVELEKMFSKDELKSAFISFPKDTIKFGKCLRALYFNGLRMPSNDASTVAEMFNRYIKNFIEMNVIYKEGEKQGLLYSPEVQKYLKMWSEFYSFETIRGRMLDTVKVSQDQIRSAYNTIYKAMSDNTFLKFDYACFHDSAAAGSAIQKINNGLAFDSLKNHNNLKIENSFFSNKEKWVAISDCGESKTQLLQHESGEVLGPINYDSLYIVLKIIDKKKSKELMGYASFEESYPKLKRQLAWEKIKSQIKNKTADFAVNTNVRIDYEALKKVDITRISSMTVRFMGFGGSISGVPVYTPNFEWTDLLDSKTLLP